MINQLQNGSANSSAQRPISSDISNDADHIINTEKLPLPLPIKFNRCEPAKCRKLLAQIRSASFLVHDSEALATLKDHLSSALMLIQSYITKEDGID